MRTELRHRARAAAAIVIALLTACAAPGTARDGADSPAGLDATDQSVHVDLIRKMLDQQQYYAALAHIQQQQRTTGNSEQLRFLEADARRSLGQTAAAQALYRGLLEGQYAAEAYHGLGLLYAASNMNLSIQYLREAARRQPTNASARSDLGYALMSAGRYSEALPEVSTAVELDPASDKARNNLLLLLMANGDERRVQQVINEAAVPADVVARLRADARNLQARNAGSGVGK
jgi:Flp pilus assembly protein TadD